MSLARALPFALALALAAAPRPVAACLVAHQVRLVVLGGAGDSLLALELEQVRDGDLETGREWFSITPRLVAIELDASGTESTRAVLAGWPRARVDAGQADAWLERAYDSAMLAARSRPGFVPAIAGEQVECDYLARCDGYRVIASGLADPRGSAHRVTTPTLLVDGFGGAPGDLRGHGIERVERVRVGARRLAVVTMGTGWDQDPCEHAAGACVDERAPRRRQPGSLRHRRGLHHGRDWDVLVLE
ncbi:MAG: hypothetical protein KC468_28035 [Myxococcales bacterium]|nr:hypothetical protein [Myxococcales bacterium]